VEFIILQEESSSGVIVPYNPMVQMVGAENRGNVTCYLDALLFAMFAKLDAFECMLKTEFTEESRRKLVTLLRLWVNMLRSGKLIHTDMVWGPHLHPNTRTFSLFFFSFLFFLLLSLSLSLSLFFLFFLFFFLTFGTVY
jgi:hypothetical protein